MSLVGRFFAWLGRGIASIFWSLLGLNGDQQRALMTWAILIGMAVLSFGAWQLVDLMVIARATSAELAEICKLVIVLLGLFCGACVLIARGGEMTIKAPGGLEISARGSAAKELGKTSTAAADVLAPPPAPPAPDLLGNNGGENVR